MHYPLGYLTLLCFKPQRPKNTIKTLGESLHNQRDKKSTQKAYGVKTKADNSYEGIIYRNLSMNRLIHSFKLSREQALGLLKEMSKICHDQKLLLSERKLSMNNPNDPKAAWGRVQCVLEKKPQTSPVRFKQHKELWAWSNQKSPGKGNLEPNLICLGGDQKDGCLAQDATAFY